jgi:hypothetical protein
VVKSKLVGAMAGPLNVTVSTASVCTALPSGTLRSAIDAVGCAPIVTMSPMKSISSGGTSPPPNTAISKSGESSASSEKAATPGAVAVIGTMKTNSSCEPCGVKPARAPMSLSRPAVAVICAGVRC